MTCFWDGILRSLDLSDFYFIGITYKPLTARQLCIFFIKHNSITSDVRCNGNPLTISQLQENFVAVNELDIEKIGDGYLCSTLDPFLCLISQIFRVDIEHDYNGVVITYNIVNSRKTIRYRSDLNHFWYG